MSKLTAKQEQFCLEYLIDLNATQAAIRAGYSEKTAKDIACENLAKPNISARIAELQAERQERTKVTGDMVIQELAKMAFFNMGEVIEPTGHLKSFDKWEENQLAAITEITTDTLGSDQNALITRQKVKMADKKGSLELLGRHLKLFTDKVEHAGEIKLSHEDWLETLE